MRGCSNDRQKGWSPLHDLRMMLSPVAFHRNCPLGNESIPVKLGCTGWAEADFSLSMPNPDTLNTVAIHKVQRVSIN
jgi:hypothetical protein